MRNYSDLFGSEMGRRHAPTQQRQAAFIFLRDASTRATVQWLCQDIIGTSTCTFLDHRGEIEAARREEGRPNQGSLPGGRQCHIDMMNDLSGWQVPPPLQTGRRPYPPSRCTEGPPKPAACPGRRRRCRRRCMDTRLPEAKRLLNWSRQNKGNPPRRFPSLALSVSHQALAVERGVWDSKEGMAINAEVSRACLGLPWIVLRSLCFVGILPMVVRYPLSMISGSCKAYFWGISRRTRGPISAVNFQCFFFARTWSNLFASLA